MSNEELAITGDKLDLIKRTVAKGASNDELELFLYTARRTGLDPLTKQIYCIKRGKQGEETMAIQTGIDGYRAIADRTGKYAGNDDPIFDSEERPKKATVSVYKIVDGVRCAFTASARMAEYHPGEGKQGFFWRKMPLLMLGKVAEALALRKAFPRDLSGIYVKEEMDQADREQEVETPLPERQPWTSPAQTQTTHLLPKEKKPDQKQETFWTCNILDVKAHKPPGKNYTVYTIETDHPAPKQPGTIKKELADQCGGFIGAGMVELLIKPGRFAGTWEAVDIQPMPEQPTLEEEFAQKEADGEPY